ncbi:MAG: YfiR family protein [Cytophagales bacterium]|nr:MAG: YfiR family protein [Cytophagales bacterium]
MKKSHIILFILFIFFEKNYIQAQNLDKKMMSLYVLNFAKHIQWPENNLTEYKIGVVGNSAVFEELTKLSGSKTINGKKIIVSQIEIAQMSKIKEFHVIILSESSSNIFNKCNEIASNSPILMITEKNGFVKKGAMISMLIDEEDDFKTKFQINKQKIEQVGLKVSSELLALSSK